MKRGEIYLVDLPIQNNSIQFGMRPCIIVSNENANTCSPVIHVVPLTTRKNKSNISTHIIIGVNSGLVMESIALCEQSMLIDKKIILKKVGELDKKTLNQVDIALLIQFGLLEKIKNTILNFQSNKKVCV